MYEIEKGIKIPRKGKSNEFPLNSMEVTDSFSIPVPEGSNAEKFAANIRVKLFHKAKQEGRKYKVCLVEDKTIARVWRVL